MKITSKKRLNKLFEESQIKPEDELRESIIAEVNTKTFFPGKIYKIPVPPALHDVTLKKIVEECQLEDWTTEVQNGGDTRTLILS